MNQPYNTDYQPAIPTLDVRLYSSISDQFTETFPAILDTGSDATLVPLSYLRAIGAEETSPGWMIGITGDRQPVSLYFVDVYVGQLAFAGIRVIGDKHAQEIILGRDVLNKLSLFLDGPQQKSSLLDEAIVHRLRSQ
jgi:predicted aspartyl protease